MDSWRYEPTGDFDQAPIQRLKNFPRHPNFTVYTLRSLANLLIRGGLRLWNRMEVEGRENLPSEGSFVMIANHSSHLDTLALLAALPLRKIHRAFPAAASDYFFTDLPKIVFSAVIVNAMPFDRRDNPLRSLDLCRQLLETPGHILILFPEGTRTSDGTIGGFKPGIGFLIAGSDIPVVPCNITGAFQAWRKGMWLPRPRKLRVMIGSPLSFADRKPVRPDVDEITKELRNAVIELAPQLW